MYIQSETQYHKDCYFILWQTHNIVRRHTQTHTQILKSVAVLCQTPRLLFDLIGDMLFFYCLFRITEVEISPIFKKLWNCCKCSDWQAGTNSKIWTEQTLACWSGASFFFFLLHRFNQSPVSNLNMSDGLEGPIAKPPDLFEHVSATPQCNFFARSIFYNNFPAVAYPEKFISWKADKTVVKRCLRWCEAAWLTTAVEDNVLWKTKRTKRSSEV